MVSGYFRVRVGYLGRAVGFVRVPMISLGHAVFTWFIQFHVGSFRRVNWSPGFACVHLYARLFHSGSLGFTRARIGVAGIDRIRVGSLGRA